VESLRKKKWLFDLRSRLLSSLRSSVIIILLCPS